MKKKFSIKELLKNWVFVFSFIILVITVTAIAFYVVYLLTQWNEWLGFTIFIGLVSLFVALGITLSENKK